MTVPKPQLAELRQHNVSAPSYQRISHRKRLTTDEVIELSKRGVANGSIIFFLYSSGSQFSLSHAQVAQLKRDGVSPDVVTFMVENQRPNLLTAWLEL